MTLDKAGNMWVADAGNQRVLRFPSSGGVISKTADLVLGQSDFTTRNMGGIFNYPGSLRFGPSDELYVGSSQAAIGPIPVFTAPFTNGMAASSMFGSGFKGSYIGEVILPSQSDNPGIWIQNYGTWYEELWGFDGVKKRELTMGHAIGGGVGIDADNGLIFSGYGSGAVFYVKADNNYAGLGPDRGIYTFPNKKLFDEGFNSITNRRLIHAAWVGMGVTADQLIVADEHRLQFWNGLSNLTNGQAPSGKVNIPGQTNYGGMPTTQINTDSANRVWVVTDRRRVDVYQAPLTENSTPIKQVTFPLQTIDGQTISYVDAFDGVAGLAVSSDSKYLWISQQDKHRVLRVKDPLTDPKIDVVLGQTSLAGTQCNQGLMGVNKNAPSNLLCFPGALALDKLNNLYISDNFIETAGNGRMLMFSKTLLPDNPATVIFALTATKLFPYETWQSAFDSTNRMVVGFNPYSRLRFPAYFNDPTSASTTPDGNLKDFYSWAIASAFDSQDNLYVYDANRGQVRIYKTPFIGSSPSSVPSPIPVSDKRVFVSSTTYSGNLGGLSGADSKCQERANVANLGGTWKAWLSDGTTSAASRLVQSDAPFNLINGTIVANSWADLTDGSLQNPITISELGTAVSAGYQVWTNTLASGQRRLETTDCANWTSGAASLRGGFGTPYFQDLRWTEEDPIGLDCDLPSYLYCFEQPNPVTPTPTPIPTPLPSPTPGSQQTISFNNKAVGILIGQYPKGVINWGTSRKWYLSPPWELFTTRSLTFNGTGIFTESFTFITPKQLNRLDAYNGNDNGPSTVTLSCPGQPNKVVSIPKNTKTTIETGWNETCTIVTINSSNGEDTNYDNMVIQ